MKYEIYLALLREFRLKGFDVVVVDAKNEKK